jgi:hypothetical protein
VQRLASGNAHEIYLWTPKSNVCGVLRPQPLESVRLDFPFDVNPEGIFVILTSDLEDQLLLDYSVGAGGEHVLDIEASGGAWGCTTY